MEKNTIDIKAESFPWHVKLIGALFLFGAVMAIMNYWWISIILALAGVLLLTGYSGTEINIASKTFREYQSYLFIRTGATEKYDKIERIFINDKKVQTHTAHPSRLYFFRDMVCESYLKFADGRKIFLTSRKDKGKLIELLNPVAAALSVDLADNTIKSISNNK